MQAATISNKTRKTSKIHDCRYHLSIIKVSSGIKSQLAVDVDSEQRQAIPFLHPQVVDVESPPFMVEMPPEAPPNARPDKHELPL